MSTRPVSEQPQCPTCAQREADERERVRKSLRDLCGALYSVTEFSIRLLELLEALSREIGPEGLAGLSPDVRDLWEQIAPLGRDDEGVPIDAG